MATLQEKYPLENSKPLKKTLERIGGFVPILLFFVLPLIIFIPSQDFNLFLSKTMAVIIVLALFVLYSICIYIYEVFYMKHYFYDVNGKTLIIKKGVFSKNEISLPFNRLQDVYVDQDILDRMFGLYDVHVSSATFVSGWLSHIDGLNKKNSEIIKEMLLEDINKHGE